MQRIVKAPSPERVAATRLRSRAWYAENGPAGRASRQAYYNANKDRFRRNHKAWMDANPESKMLSHAKHRAKRNQLPFDIDINDIVIPDRCPVLGIEISFSVGIDHRPSIDRVKNDLGYVKGNIIIVSWRANRLKNDASPSELKMLAEFYGRLP